MYTKLLGSCGLDCGLCLGSDPDLLATEFLEFRGRMLLTLTLLSLLLSVPDTLDDDGSISNLAWPRLILSFCKFGLFCICITLFFDSCN